jgi:hypothetical protein
MANKRGEASLGATDSSLRPGSSPLSRAAARSLLAFRTESGAQDESFPDWWDREPTVPDNLAETLAAARAAQNKRQKRGEPEPETD